MYISNRCAHRIGFGEGDCVPSSEGGGLGHFGGGLVEDATGLLELLQLAGRHLGPVRQHLVDQPGDVFMPHLFETIRKFLE
jgi:hypothetical protein